MTYYIVMEKETPKDLWDENILGEESFGKFYTGNGFTALNRMVNRTPEALGSVMIIDEKGSKYSLTEFLDVVKDWKIVVNNA